MPAITFIGAIIGVVASRPATVDASGFGALTYTTIGSVVSWGSPGDTSEDVTIPLLAGRTLHVNGQLDGGSMPFAVQYESADAGQAILLAQNNGNTDCSIKIIDPDGQVTYAFGRIANVKMQERTGSNYKGFTGEFRINSRTVIV